MYAKNLKLQHKFSLVFLFAYYLYADSCRYRRRFFCEIILYHTNQSIYITKMPQNLLKYFNGKQFSIDMPDYLMACKFLYPCIYDVLGNVFLVEFCIRPIPAQNLCSLGSSIFWSQQTDFYHNIGDFPAEND